MFDGLFEIIAKTLAVFYDLVPNYAFAIAMLTLVVMVITTPFTLKGTRSMIQMQRLQPEMRRLQVQHKDDRQKLNEELMAFYKENNLNPLGGCLPLLLQTPIFIILYNVVQGLTRREDGGTFNPKYLDEGARLFRDLDPAREMMAFGVDLAESASKSLSQGFIHGLPHVVLVAIVAVSSYYQQKQIQGRNPNIEMPAQQKMLMRLMPAMFVVVAFVAQSALVIYFVTSNLYRIGMQAYITRTLYHGEDSLGAQAQRAALEAKALKDSGATPELLPRLGKKARSDAAAAAASTTGPAKGAKAAKTPPAASASGSARPAPAAPTGRTTAPNRSKKKKKRR
jgi:YidC/Oxa1 family membrane protein insertase